MFKLVALLLVMATSFWSLPGFAQDTPTTAQVQGEKPQESSPAPASTPPAATGTPATEPPAVAPSSKPSFKRSVIGRPVPVHAPGLAGSPLPVFVDDVRTLADLVSEDKGLAPSAENLAARRSFLGYFAPTTAIVSAGLIILGSLMRVDAGEWGKASGGLTIGGSGLFLLSAVVVGAVYPTRSETLDVINAWNHSHPDRPIFP